MSSRELTSALGALDGVHALLEPLLYDGEHPSSSEDEDITQHAVDQLHKGRQILEALRRLEDETAAMHDRGVDYNARKDRCDQVYGLIRAAVESTRPTREERGAAWSALGGYAMGLGLPADTRALGARDGTCLHPETAWRLAPPLVECGDCGIVNTLMDVSSGIDTLAAWVRAHAFAQTSGAVAGPVPPRVL